MARPRHKSGLKFLKISCGYGRNKTTRYTQENELKEFLNIMAVVYDEDPDHPYMPEFFPFSQKDLDQYYPQVLSAKQIPGLPTRMANACEILME